MIMIIGRLLPQSFKERLEPPYGLFNKIVVTISGQSGSAREKIFFVTENI
jgi:hypothetical protein